MRCIPQIARLLLLIALIGVPIWSEAQPPAIGLRLDPQLNAPADVSVVPVEPSAPDALRLRLALELRGTPAPALGGILGAIALFLAANVALLLLFSIVMRIWRESRQRRHARFSELWEPVLHARMSGDLVPLPAMADSERLLFLNLWLHLLGYVRDQAADALAQAARELDIPNYALRLLESRSPWKRVLAVRAVAALHLEEAGSVLLAKVMERRPRSSLAAARALLQIDPQRGFVGLEYLLHQLDWSPAAMVSIVKAGGAETVHKLAGLVRSAPPGRAKPLVRLIELLEDHSALPALRERLESSSDEEEIAAILHCLGRHGQEADRAAALGYLAHPNWLIRMQAAYAMGALGSKRDAARLAPLLHDRQWWVRYRTAQSILRLAGAAALAAMRESEPDPYARDLLERVLAEAR
jgi:HEAT repeat protein